MMRKATKEKVRKLNARINAKARRISAKTGIDVRGIDVSTLSLRGNYTQAEMRKYYRQAEKFLTRGYSPVQAISGRPYATEKEVAEYQKAIKIINKLKQDRIKKFKEIKLKSGGLSQSDTLFDYYQRLKADPYNPLAVAESPEIMGEFPNREKFLKALNRVKYQSSPEYIEKKAETLRGSLLGVLENDLNVQSELLQAIQEFSVDDINDLFFSNVDIFELFEWYFDIEKVADRRESAEAAIQQKIDEIAERQETIQEMIDRKERIKQIKAVIDKLKAEKAEAEKAEAEKR